MIINPTSNRPFSALPPIAALFHEYFHADTGRGAGASHQIGWTGLAAKTDSVEPDLGILALSLTPAARCRFYWHTKRYAAQ
jgi:hypothetical protein